LAPEVWVNVFLAVLLIVLTAFFFRSSGGSAKGSSNKASSSPSPTKQATSAATAGASVAATALQPKATDSKISGVKDEELRAASVQKGALTASAAAAAMKDKSVEAYSGVVKRYSERNGMGFISCDALKEKHGVDVRVFREEVEEKKLQVGDHVEFHIVLGGRPLCRADHPWATQVVKVEAPGPESRPAAQASATASPSGGGLRADAAEWHPSSRSAQNVSGASPASTRLDPKSADFVPSGTTPDQPQSAHNRSQLNAGAAEFVPQVPGTGTLQ